MQNGIPIDFTIVDKMLESGCDGVQIASRLGCHPDTLYIRTHDVFDMTFSAYASLKRAKGDSFIHETQYDLATKDRDKTMLIWLGKQRLGQKEPKDTKDIDSDFVKNFMLALAQGKLLEFCLQKDEQTAKKIVHDSGENERHN